MNESTRDAVVNELIQKAASHLESVTAQIGDALGNLEDREVLGAIGALTGCEEGINRANLVLIIARDYADKLARARAAVSEGKNNAEQTANAEQGSTAELAEEYPHSAIEVVLPHAAFEALEKIEVIAFAYEFNCLRCNTHNTLVVIPKYGTAVKCRNCHAMFRIHEKNHAKTD